MTAIHSITCTLAQAENSGLNIDPATLGQYGTWIAVFLLGFGALMLLFGIKLLRLLFTLIFAGLGAGMGVGIGMALTNWVGWEWAWLAGAITGTVLIGLIGFLLYRFWTMLAFATMLAWIAAGVGLWVKADGDPAGAWNEVVQKFSQAKEKTKLPAEGGIELPEAPAEGEQVDPNQVARQMGEDWWSDTKGNLKPLTDEVKPYALVMSLAGLGGFVFGLVFAAFAFRPAAVLWSSIVGLVNIVAGTSSLLRLHKPELLSRYGNLAWWQQMAPLAGLLLIGIAIQALLARKKKPTVDEGLDDIDLD